MRNERRPTMWKIAVQDHVLWSPYGHVDWLGLGPPPTVYIEDDSPIEAIRIWAALYDRRRRAFDAWYRRELSLASAAVAEIRDRMIGREPAAVFAARGAQHVAAFGWDGYGHQIDDVRVAVGMPTDGGHDCSGATVVVEIGETFGGGDNWFGPPGHRTYRVSIPVEGRTGWTVPDRDPGLNAIVDRARARREAAWARYNDALKRVQATSDAAWGRAQERFGSWGYRRLADRARAISDRLYAQLKKIDPLKTSTEWTTYDIDLCRPIDIWPGMSAPPRRTLPVLNATPGWFALTSELRAA